MEQPRIRVAAYVTRCRGADIDLLVFDHIDMPEAGTQIPAGGVRPGEELETAVLREVAEETGLLDTVVAGCLATDHRPHPGTRQSRRTTFFHLRAAPATPDSWTHRVTGGDEDEGMRFACRFERLPLAIRLADHQDVWLGRLADAVDDNGPEQWRCR
ncbi:NUDIX domain-containing protein [Nocardia sp. NPDC051750]|uniref:NUDIX hydrolase n=1 Tax=Nocardia sp. NPDC051750 TaxID=3364325 RepID=UPI0037AB5BC3